MRIQIKGEITAERLVEAFQVAMEKLESVSPGARVFGANLYIKPYDADGLAFELGNNHGEELIISISAPAGTTVRPKLTAEGERQKEEAKRQQKEAELEYERQAQARRQELERQRSLAAAEEAKLFGYEQRTAERLAENHEQFVADLNAIVREVWTRLQPVERNGRYKGRAKPMPIFQADEKGLLMSSPDWKSARRVRNPVFRMDYRKVVPIWGGEAWAEVCERVKPMIE